MVGVLLFQNTKNIDWNSMEEAVPAFCVLFFIPFTYSILQGVSIGYVIYLIIAIFSNKSLQVGRKIFSEDGELTLVQKLQEWVLLIFYNGNENPVNIYAALFPHTNKEATQISSEISTKNSMESSDQIAVNPIIGSKVSV